MLRRFSVFSLALLLCLSLFPARALADVGNASVLWSGSIDDGARFGAFVKGGTRYDAAVASLGYDSSRLSDEVKAKLSDSAHGGMFYTFANAFSSVSSPIEIPSWVPAFVTTSSVIADLLNNISGENYPHWSVAVTYSVYDLALRDFLVVLNGGDSGGGGSGGSDPTGIYSSDYTIVSLRAFDSTDPRSSSYDGYNLDCQVGSWSDGRFLLGSGSREVSAYVRSTHYMSNILFYASSDVVDFVNGYVSQGYDVVLAGSTVLVGHNLSMVYGSYGTAGGNVNSYRLFGDSAVRFSISRVGYFYDGDDAFVVVNGVGGSGSSVELPFIVPFWSAVITSPLPDPVGVRPPSGVWPDSPEPASPTAPELPEPATPTVETPVTPTVPAPVWPDITINIEPDPTPGTTPSGLDYTELLTRINDNLISIDSFARAINSNLNSLRSDLLAEFNGVIDSLRNIYNYLLTIDSVLETHCTHLRNKIEQSAVFIANYMRTLIKWLADQLDFDDLTNVEAPDNSLLTTINEKLGGGTYEPNPIKDESAYYEWLDDLWDRFLLGDNWQSSMGSISGSFSELKTRFPFSVPWDIVALFRLFVHDPVTPVFDLPLYFSPDGSTPVHVDLSPWDSVASLVRPMVFVIFALKLALLSRDLLGGLGADKGGL